LLLIALPPEVAILLSFIFILVLVRAATLVAVAVAAPLEMLPNAIGGGDNVTDDIDDSDDNDGGDDIAIRRPWLCPWPPL
jgi:hypothetical protein